MATTCLIITDVQKGFINASTEHIPATVEALQRDYDHIVATRFFNPPQSFYRSLIGWDRFAPGSADIPLAFTPRDDAVLIDKDTYTCLTPELRQKLDEWGGTQVHLCGIATDNCVLKTAVDLFESGIKPVVLAHATASHGGRACHEAGMLLLGRFIGADQVIQ